MELTEFIIDDVRVDYDLEALGKKLRSPALAGKLLGSLANEASAIARPKAAGKCSGVRFGRGDEVFAEGIAFVSPLLKEKFTGLHRVFPFLATEGAELAEWGRTFSGLARLLANALQQEAMHTARRALENFILEKFGLKQVSALNPGSLPVWPITQQAPLFKLLSPLDEKLEVTLWPSFMMKPEQTTSGFFFQTDSKFHNCQLCPREDCPNRRAPYNAHSGF